MRRQDSEERGAHSSAYCVWLLCNYCRFSVSTVLLRYMKDSYLLCQERAFISHLNYQVLKKNLKHSSHEQYLKDQWPAIVLEKKLLVFLFICIVFL